MTPQQTVIEVMVRARELEFIHAELRLLLMKLIKKQKGEVSIVSDIETAEKVFNLMELNKR